jgi:hypothetical protein
MGASSLLACSVWARLPLGGERQELLVSLPPAPPSWAALPDLRMAVTWKGIDGRLSSALALPGTRLRVEVERGEPQALLALPSSAGRGLRPAGAIYPRDGSDELELDWVGGYAASLARALAGGGLDPWSYDLDRLAKEAAERCGDPWLKPILETARALADGDFRIDHFREPERFPVRLEGEGPWAPDSPLAPAPGSDSGGKPPLANLPEGLWRFLGAAEELLVSVDGQGGALLLRRPQAWAGSRKPGGGASGREFSPGGG